MSSVPLPLSIPFAHDSRAALKSLLHPVSHLPYNNDLPFYMM